MRYVRISSTRILYLDNNGDPAVGYKVYTCLPGTTTLAPTWNDRDLAPAHLNENPISTDSRGQIVVFANSARKLILCLPTSTGPGDGVIQSDDWLGEQPPSIIDEAFADPGTVDNQYTAETDPLYTEQPASLIFIPDVDCQGTILAPGTSFFGPGINDGRFSGHYSGSSPNSIFEAEIDSVFQNPPSAPTIAQSADAGVVTAGSRKVAVTFVTAEGETSIGDESNSVVVDGSHKLSISNIPLGANGVTSRKIYMPKVGLPDFYLAATIANNVDTTLELDVADASLIDLAPAANTTGGGTGEDTIKWRKDSNPYTTGLKITAEDMVLIEGMIITFTEKVGHTLGSRWTVQVMTPATLDFCSLGAAVIFKSLGNDLVTLDEKDMRQGIPAHLDWAPFQNYYILLNPALPVLVELQPTFEIKEIEGNYTVTSNDNRKFLNCSKGGTITLPPAPSTAGFDVWISSKDGMAVTVNVDGGTDTILPPFGSPPVTSMVIGSDAGIDTVRLASNAVYWETVQISYVPHGFESFMTPGTFSWTCPASVHKAWLTGCAPGGGGAGALSGGAGDTDAGSGGEPGESTFQEEVAVEPGTTYTVTIPDAADGGIGNSNGETGGNTSFGALLTLVGGNGGIAGAGNILPTPAAFQCTKGLNGKGGMFGDGGEGSLSLAEDGFADSNNGFDGTGFGSGGGGASSVGGGSSNGGKGGPGFLGLEY